MFRFPERGIFITHSRLFEFGLIPFHMIDTKITEHDQRISCTMHPIREIKILIDEIEFFIKQYILEDMCRSEQRISGIHLNIVSRLVSQLLRDRPGKEIIEMGESLVLDLSCLPVHQRWCKDEILLYLCVIFIPERQRSLQIIFLEPFVVVHQLDELPCRFIDSEIPQCARIVVRNSIRLLADIMDISRIMEHHIRIHMFVDNENYLKILEGLPLQAFGDIFHILISPGRDDDAKFHKR